MAHKRCPRGYHLENWADGTWHVYFGGGCISEELTRKEALEVAYQDRDKRHEKALNEVLVLSKSEQEA